MESELMEVRSLNAVLDKRRKEFEETVYKQTRSIYSEAITFVKESGVEGKARTAGDRAPNFKLRNAVSIKGV